MQDVVAELATARQLLADTADAYSQQLDVLFLEVQQGAQEQQQVRKGKVAFRATLSTCQSWRKGDCY